MAKGKTKGVKRKPQITGDHLWDEMGMENWMAELVDSQMGSGWKRTKLTETRVF